VSFLVQSRASVFLWTQCSLLVDPHGHTRQGIHYLDFYVKHLGHAGFAVGGLLGEDDHKDVMIPPASCAHHTSLSKVKTGPASVSSVAMAM